MLKQGYGITFGDYHSWRDLGLAMDERQEIGAATPDLTLLDVAGRSKPLDVSEALTGRVEYKKRKLSFPFVLREGARDWAWRYSDLQEKLHGKRMRIFCDDDPYFYYEGRVQVDPVKSSRYLGKIVITAEVDPYKYEITSSVEPWLWSPFDFRVGVIRNYGRLLPDGTLDEEHSIKVTDEKVLEVIGSQMPVVPTFYAISDGCGISVTFQGETYDLFEVDADQNVIDAAGGKQFPEIELLDDTYALTFTGNGAVAVEYRGGRL